MSLAETDETLQAARVRDTRCTLGRRLSDSDRDWLSREDVSDARKIAALMQEFGAARSTAQLHLRRNCRCYR